MTQPKPVDPLEALGRSNVRGVMEVLEQLSRLKRRRDEGLPLNLPQVTLYLRSGRELTGLVAELCDFRQQGRGVLLHSSGGGYGRGDSLDVTFVPEGVIEALTVHNPAVLDTPDRSMPESSPMHLRRMVPALAEKLSSAWGQPVTAEFSPGLDLDPALHVQAMAWLIEHTGSSLLQLTKVPDAGDVLRETVRKVRLGIGSEFHAKRSGDVLELTTSSHPTDWPSDEGLIQAVTDTLP